MPDQVGHDGRWLGTVTPGLTRGPAATVGPECPIKSGMTVEG